MIAFLTNAGEAGALKSVQLTSNNVSGQCEIKAVDEVGLVVLTQGGTVFAVPWTSINSVAIMS